MDVSQVRRLAAEVLGVGVNRVRIDPEYLDFVVNARTKEDVRRMIKEGYISKRPIKGTSTARAKKLKEQRKKGRRRGPGSRKGKKSTREGGKEPRVRNIRAIRRLLRQLRDEGKIERKVYRELYRKAKGGYFRSKRHVLLYIKERGLYVQRRCIWLVDLGIPYLIVDVARGRRTIIRGGSSSSLSVRGSSYAYLIA